VYAPQQATLVRPCPDRHDATMRPGAAARQPGPGHAESSGAAATSSARPRDAGSRGPRRVLSAREVQVLSVIARGGTKAAAAEELGIAPQTVKSHLGHIFCALGARNAAHAVALGHCRGLLGGAGRVARAVEVSRREVEILEGIAHGMTDEQLARRLAISKDTVKTHLRRIYPKLEVASRVQAVDEAFRTGLLIPRRSTAPAPAGAPAVPAMSATPAAPPRSVPRRVA
jgi:DNA-binding NarL/FixJ family response regulator